MNGILDDTIRDCYMAFGVAADQIVTDPDVAEQFAGFVNSNLTEGRTAFGVATINRRLLTLRKRGEEKGGLPRLERAYFGRVSRN